CPAGRSAARPATSRSASRSPTAPARCWTRRPRTDPYPRRMPPELNDAARKLLEQPYYAVVAVPRADDSLQTVLTWVHTDDGNVALSSAEGRSWPANLRRAGRATVTVVNPQDPYEWVSVSGRVLEDTHDGADEHIDFLAKKYLDADGYTGWTPGMQRVKF